MLHIAPSGRTRVSLPPCLCRHVIPATTLLVAVGFAACFRVHFVRSFAPAIDDSAALDVPGFVGSWTDAEGARWEVSPDSGVAAAYVVAVGPTAEAAATRGPARDERTYFEARIGRAGPALLLEMRPDLARDTLLARISDSYSYQLERVYLVERFELERDRFILIEFVQDSVEAAVRDGRCATPFVPDTTRGMILSGTSAEVRAAWACVVAQPGVVGDSTIMLREIIPRALAGSQTPR